MSCSVRMIVLEIVVHQLDTIMSMMYVDADNSDHWQFFHICNCIICLDVTLTNTCHAAIRFESANKCYDKMCMTKR